MFYLVAIFNVEELGSGAVCMSKCENTASSVILALQIGHAVKPSSRTLIKISPLYLDSNLPG